MIQLFIDSYFINLSNKKSVINCHKISVIQFLTFYSKITINCKIPKKIISHYKNLVLLWNFDCKINVFFTNRKRRWSILINFILILNNKNRFLSLKFQNFGSTISNQKNLVKFFPLKFSFTPLYKAFNGCGLDQFYFWFLGFFQIQFLYPFLCILLCHGL